MSRLEPGWGHLKKRDGEPVFHEPWQAQVLAMADLLIASGRISGARWAEALGREAASAKALEAADDSETFFRAALAALERLLAESGDVPEAELEQREHEWERAHLVTPHGQPVELSAGRDGI